MTTTVRKGANRAAGAAKTTKAAQRTPLPGDEAPETELPAKATPKARVPRTPKDAGKTASDVQEAVSAPTKSRLKADDMAALLTEHGWTFKVTDEGERTTLVSIRGTERLKQVWDEGRWIYRETRYTNGTRASKPRNANAVRRLYAPAKS